MKIKASWTLEDMLVAVVAFFAVMNPWVNKECVVRSGGSMSCNLLSGTLIRAGLFALVWLALQLLLDRFVRKEKSVDWDLFKKKSEKK